MSDLLHRVKQATTVLNDPSIPQSERLDRGLEALSGLDITNLDSDAWQLLEKSLATVTRLLEAYDLEGADGQPQVSERDLQRGVELLGATLNMAMEAELDRIVMALDKVGRKIPVDAIRQAREHRDLMVPRLIRVLRETTSAAAGGYVSKGDAHVFALLLLSEFQAGEALPAILEAMSLPGTLPLDLFDDVVTSILRRVLAQFAGERPEVIDKLIADRGLNEFVRWAAAETYINLIRDGRLTRAEAVLRLQQHLQRALKEEDRPVIGPLVFVLSELSAKEAVDEIQEAYDRHLADGYLISLREVDESLREGAAKVEETLSYCPPTGILDTIEEVQYWAVFQKEPKRREPKSTGPILTSPTVPHLPPTPQIKASAPPPAPTQSARVGRNDPCPCGSGKKFKKCCASRV